MSIVQAEPSGTRVFTSLNSPITLSLTSIPNNRSHANGSPQTHTRSSRGPTFWAAASCPVNPVYPVYRCSLMQPTGLPEAQRTGNSGRIASYNPSSRVSQAKNTPAGTKVDTPTTQAGRVRPVLFKVRNASSSWQPPIPKVATVPATAPWAHQGQSGGPGRNTLQ